MHEWLKIQNYWKIMKTIQISSDRVRVLPIEVDWRQSYGCFDPFVDLKAYPRSEYWFFYLQPVLAVIPLCFTILQKTEQQRADMLLARQVCWNNHTIVSSLPLWVRLEPCRTIFAFISLFFNDFEFLVVTRFQAYSFSIPLVIPQIGKNTLILSPL